MSEAPLTILLVEDNPAHAEMILRSLEEHEVANHVTWLEDGETALDYLFRRGRYAEPSESPVPFVILLDLRLPRVDGLQALPRIQALAPGAKVILSSGYTSQEVHGLLHELGADAFLQKPYDSVQLEEALARALGTLPSGS